VGSCAQSEAGLGEPLSQIGWFHIKSKLLQKPHVVFVEQADVVDAVAEHGDAFGFI
jgi:hypothetical protein